MSSRNITACFLEREYAGSDSMALSVWADSGNRQTTFRQLSRASLAISARLQRLGFQGENIGVLLPNSVEFAAVFLGILHSGNTVVPLNYLLKPPELVTLAEHAGLRLLLADENLEGLAKAVAEGVSGSLVVERAGQWMEDSGEEQPPQALTHDPAMILYTSGTTGDPKGVMLSHENVLSNCEAYFQLFNFTPDHQFVVVLPLFHTFAITTNLLAMTRIGCSLHLVPRFQPKLVDQLIRGLDKVVFVAVPSLYNLMARLPGKEPLLQIEYAVSGGAALPVEVQQAFMHRFGVDILEGYGLTEAAPVVCCNVPGSNRPGTIGPPLPGVKVAVWDESGRPLPPGKPGELMVQGPNVMMGYYKNPAASGKALAEDGWLHTGDMAELEDDGWVRIVGRKKEIIVCAGENIYPREIEDVLLRHPEVFEAAVVPMPDRLRGETAKAYAAPVEGGRLEPVVLREWCRRHLAEYKVPKVFEVMESLPKTATGKISKKVLAEKNL
jgi:long-chain acyl-CoA synthetase